SEKSVKVCPQTIYKTVTAALNLIQIKFKKARFIGEARCCGPSHAPRRGGPPDSLGTCPLRKEEANLETRTGWRRRLAALCLAALLLLPCMPRALAADLNVDAGFYLKQSRSGTCTLTAAAMMLRRRAYLDGLADWVDVTENNVRPAAWPNGLPQNFTSKAMKVRYPPGRKEQTPEPK